MIGSTWFSKHLLLILPVPHSKLILVNPFQIHGAKRAHSVTIKFQKFNHKDNLYLLAAF